MADQQQFTTDEILMAIGAQMKLQTDHLSHIRLYVGFMALITMLSIVFALIAASGG